MRGIRRPQQAWALLGGAAMALVLGGCLSSTDPTGARSQAPAPTVAATTPTSAPTVNSPPTSPVPPAPPTCTTGQLTVTVKAVNSGLNHGGSVVVFENKAKTCQLRGYPGLDGVDANGTVVVSARRTPSGYLGGPGDQAGSAVVLGPGEAASALFEGINAPPSGEPPCPRGTALLVTPPDETHSVRVPETSGVCDLLIHPVVAGSTGAAYVP